TSPFGTPDGFYSVGVSATNALTSSYAASGSATYVISTPVPLSIGVTTNQSTYSPGQTVYVTVTMLSGSSPDAGASISVNVTKPNGVVSSLSGTTGSNGVATLKYRLKRQDPAGTYSVTASAALTGNSATIGASTSFAVQ